jgi:hypothetical protein
MPEPTVLIEATRFTVTPPIDVVDLHSIQVHVEQRRGGRWTVAYQGDWFDAAGVHHPASGVNAARCSHDFATAIRLAVEVAQGIAERWNGRG